MPPQLRAVCVIGKRDHHERRFRDWVFRLDPGALYHVRRDRAAALDVLYGLVDPQNATVVVFDRTCGIETAESVWRVLDAAAAPFARQVVIGDLPNLRAADLESRRNSSRIRRPAGTHHTLLLRSPEVSATWPFAGPISAYHYMVTYAALKPTPVLGTDALGFLKRHPERFPDWVKALAPTWPGTAVLGPMGLPRPPGRYVVS